MDEQLLQVYSTTSNAAVIRPPGRRFPGVVIQGDTLSVLARHASQLAAWVCTRKLVPNEVLGAAEELVHGLVGRALHYQEVLGQHGIALPYVGRLDERDLVEVPLRSPAVNLIVLRCQDVALSRRFYAELGLELTEERHDTGPVHYAAALGEAVLELYPADTATTVGLRLGLELGCDVAAIGRALDIGGALLEPSVLDGDARHVVLRDPDGHTLALELPFDVGEE